ncbi:DUF1801 domain-containing protein [Alteribacillus iranensis]|uniref:YdhG-like domain-containing protein n=1 Tax=Alteribacillus iranensis TaxID=930128 RepID=A0A1I2FL18_9BACI|nr:DUF1801 domain-containing protein [Alteribacillus iranensis]SFF05448.1 protein of unknown function (DU1801) [Alteribacillus iranensis]
MSDIDPYMEEVDPKWKEAFVKLKKVIDDHIPNGFEENFQNGMPTYIVPLSTYPEGYLGKKDTPLPFISIAAQKRHIALYHLGLYAEPELLEWFQEEYPNHMTTKLNMGKSCIRFTNSNNIPFSLLGQLVSKMTVNDWIALYEGQKK